VFVFIPASVTDLGQDWTTGSSIQTVQFESAVSLRRMIDHRRIELTDELHIEVANWDGQTDIPGYSAEIDAANGHLARLVKRPKSTALRAVPFAIIGMVFFAFMVSGGDK
jgi:hypothetical protein